MVLNAEYHLEGLDNGEPNVFRIARDARHELREDSGLLDVAPQPGVDRLPIEIPGLHQSDDELVVLHGVTSQLQTVQPKVHIRCGNGSALVAVEERVILDQALQQGRRLGDGVVVVTRLRPENDSLKGPEVANAGASPESLDEQSVDSKDFDDRQVLGQLLGQLLVQHTVPGD